MFSEAQAITRDCSLVSCTSGAEMEVLRPKTDTSRSARGFPVPGMQPQPHGQDRTRRRENSTAARTGLPRHPRGWAGLEGMELRGSVVLIYARLLSFYKNYCRL